MTIPSPPKTEDLLFGTKLVAGMGHSTVIADIDFETYSEAGYVWSDAKNKWIGGGLGDVGVVNYSKHTSTEVLCCAYDLKDGQGPRMIIPTAGQPFPFDLMQYLLSGGLLEAWNASFERNIWDNVCVPKYGWPPMPHRHWRCAMAKSRAFALPGSLEKAGDILNLSQKKDKEGKRLLTKFSMPRNPTKTDPRKRIYLHDEIVSYDPPDDARKLLDYNIQDIRAEAEASSLVPDLNDFELAFWQADQAINARGVQIDIQAVHRFIEIIEACYDQYNSRLREITNGAVQSANEVARLRKWLATKDLHLASLDKETVDAILNGYPVKNYIVTMELTPEVKEALEIRKMLSMASVKKLYAMRDLATTDGRVHDLFIYHGARTGRTAGAAIQPQNLKSKGPSYKVCDSRTPEPCGQITIGIDECPRCKENLHATECLEWDKNSIDWFFRAAHESQCLEGGDDINALFRVASNPIDAISGCMRGLFIAKPGHDLICSDYSAIEAVVLAALAGEDWRMEVFRTHGKIYEMSASMITGKSFDAYMNHKKENGTHHPDRKLGKVAELASGYGGWVGSWKAFGAEEFLTEDKIRDGVISWRNASPKIVEFWGGQEKHYKPCFYGVEGEAIQAVMYPGKVFICRKIEFIVRNDILFIKLLSGRYLTYHKPRLENNIRNPRTKTLSFMGWNTNPVAGKIGWVRMQTYGPKIVENLTQAHAREYMAHGIVNLENANYPVVLQVHDEIVSEVPENFGSIEEFEEIMSRPTEWGIYDDGLPWPIKSAGGWRAKRYCK